MAQRRGAAAELVWPAAAALTSASHEAMSCGASSRSAVSSAKRSCSYRRSSPSAENRLAPLRKPRSTARSSAPTAAASVPRSPPRSCTPVPVASGGASGFGRIGETAAGTAATAAAAAATSVGESGESATGDAVSAPRSSTTGPCTNRFARPLFAFAALITSVSRDACSPRPPKRTRSQPRPSWMCPHSHTRGGGAVQRSTAPRSADEPARSPE
mmetsp:Transcript_9656/g.32036  ORF Transcript_9656/g.32036 Transcript_9656/m.32036 type:complete len:214 (+) Transcript_9656:459-1100(+)